MLKGINPLLGPELLMTLRAMGHGDELAIVDGNYPADEHGRRVIRMDGHDAVTVARAILSLMPLDEFVPETAFRPGIKGQPDRQEPIFDDFEAVISDAQPGVKLTALHGDDFYNRVKNAYVVIATTERRLYGNLILRKGVIHP